MGKRKDPAFLWYPDEWIGGTRLMDFAHMGAYMECLMMQYKNGHLSIDQIKIILKSDYHLWETGVKDKFEIDDKGLYYNDKLDRVIDERRKYKDGRIENLKGHKEAHMDAPYDTPICRDRDRDRDSNEIGDVMVDEIYKLYPSKRSNGSSTGKCLKDKIKIGQYLKAGIELKGLVELYILKTNPQYYKALKTFLNNLPDLEELLRAADYRDQADKPKRNLELPKNYREGME